MSRNLLSAAHFWTWGQTSCEYTHSSKWLPPTSEQPGLVYTWLVQKVPFVLYALPPGTTWGCTTAGTTGGGPVTDTGSAEAGATTCGRSCSCAGAIDWWYIDKPVRDTRSMIVLDKILAPKYLYQQFLVNFCLELTSRINHLLYLSKLFFFLVLNLHS